MKYIDANKLRSEIDKLIDDAPSYDDSRTYLFEVCSIIDSLQQEQPEVGWVEEIDKVWNNGLSDELAGPHNDFNICARLARHFYELGKNARKV